MTFCDDLCKQIDQFESARWEGHDYSASSNLSMNSCSNAKSIHKEVISSSEDFWQRETSSSDDLVKESEKNSLSGDLLAALGCASDVIADEYSSTDNARILESDQWVTEQKHVHESEVKKNIDYDFQTHT